MVKLNLVEIKSLSTGSLGTRLKGGCVQNLGTFLMLSLLLCKKSCVIKCKAAQIIRMAIKGARDSPIEAIASAAAAWSKTGRQTKAMGTVLTVGTQYHTPA